MSWVMPDRDYLIVRHCRRSKDINNVLRFVVLVQGIPVSHGELPIMLTMSSMRWFPKTM